MTHPIARALRRLRAWRESRYWSPRRQLNNLRVLVKLDAFWMAHDRTAAALTARYADALAPDWFRRPFENSGALRDRLGLNPWRRAADSKAGSISAADIERLRKELQDAADAAVTASNQAVRYLRERDAARTDLQRETRRADYLRRQLDTIAEQNAELRRGQANVPDLEREPVAWLVTEGEATMNRVFLHIKSAERAQSVTRGSRIVPLYGAPVAPADAARPAIPHGWKLVPIEPTAEMLLAGTYRPDRRTSETIYAAMLAAAPQPEMDQRRAAGTTGAADHA